MRSAATRSTGPFVTAVTRVLAIAGLLLFGCSTPAAAPEDAPGVTGDDAQPTAEFHPTMTALMGANGAAGDQADYDRFWHPMGLTFSRLEIGPAGSTNLDELRQHQYIGDSSKYDQTILGNNANGVRTLILLAYTPNWNARVPNDSKSAPKDVSVWQEYVDFVVRRYSAPPYNVKHFQIWNEASGSLISNTPQGTFWHGPGYPGVPYANAMEDYVSLIHIPAAKIIRDYHCYVVYGGWPAEGFVEEYIAWLDHVSDVYHQTMLAWTDYLDIHYFGSDILRHYYDHYVGAGVRGIWETEVGHDYMTNHNFIAAYFFDLASFALERNWTEPDQFVAMVYHWSGPSKNLTLTDWSTGFNDSGLSLATLSSVMNGPMRRFSRPIGFSPNASGSAIYNGDQIVFQVQAPQGSATIDVDVPAPAGFSIKYVDAIDGADLSASIAESSWGADHLRVLLNVPPGKDDLHVPGIHRDRMGYVVVTPSP